MPSKAQINAKLRELYNFGNGRLEVLNLNIEKELIETYRQSLKEIRGTIAGMYENFGDDVTRFEMLKYGRLTKLEIKVRDELRRLGINTNSIIRNGVTRNFKAGYYGAGFADETALGVSMGFAELNTDVIKANILNPLDQIKWPERINGHVNVLNRQVKQALNTSLIQGYGYSRTAKEFKDKLEKTLFQTTRILRTEGQRAKSAARNIAFDRSMSNAGKVGAKVDQVWDPVFDDRTRPSHGRLRGRKRNKQGYWRFGDGTLTKGPGLSGVAKHDVNCRCDTLTEVAGLRPDSKLTKVDGDYIKISGEDYDTWAKEHGIKYKYGGVKRPRGIAQKASTAKPATKFSRAKTLPKAEEFAMTNLVQNNGRVDYSGLSVDVANEVNEALFRVRGAKYDSILSYSQRGKDALSIPMRNILRVPRSGVGVHTNTLEINKKYFNQFKSIDEVQKAIKAIHKRKWFVPESVQGVVHHEYGHKLTTFNVFEEAKNKAAKRLQKLKIVDDVDGLSKYAGTELDETLAEIFAKHMKGEKIKPAWRRLFNEYSEVKI